VLRGRAPGRPRAFGGPARTKLDSRCRIRAPAPSQGEKNPLRPRPHPRNTPANQHAAQCPKNFSQSFRSSKNRIRHWDEHDLRKTRKVPPGAPPATPLTHFPVPLKPFKIRLKFRGPLNSPEKAAAATITAGCRGAGRSPRHNKVKPKVQAMSEGGAGAARGAAAANMY